MSATIDYLNANADWRFVVDDVRGPDGTPYDLTGFAVAATFRPDADRATAIAACAIGTGIVVTPGVAGKGPTIAIEAAAAVRTWTPSRPMLVVADVMISKDGSEDLVKRLAFIAMPGT